MTDTTSLILSPYQRDGIAVRNRLAVAPMTRITATENGHPTQTMFDYYLRFAEGGFGLVTTEGIYTDKAFSQGYRFQPGLADDEQARGWTAFIRDMQKRGAHVVAQLMHAGALSQGNFYRTGTVGPSAVRPKGKQMEFYFGEGLYPEPRQMTAREIDEVVEGFVSAARRAVNIAGFNAVEIHGANGYLLDQFLTAETNRRTDRWGGDTNARVQLLADVVKEVKLGIGNAVPVGIRISQGKVNDFTAKWPGARSDAEVIFGTLAAAGADFIHVTEHEAWQPAFEGETDSLIALARRYAPDVTILANGNLHTADRIANALENGADLVTIGRGALANPDLPKVLLQKREPRTFDGSILQPVANIKEAELSMRTVD
ncbi:MULTISPECIES: NADH:flavin oxidoreductase [Paraburkholderia]|jgi:2,4-dienoyl-CoA reductase-like NADH-dependent reductase (Old Yellow Enzyme family)|uniref:NADH:flavin oxidoreductase n=2 Tax=Paraburkholderia hospita TaxID=169430 RepID=A0AAN1JDN5_9BURK|nr:NADH:flavin oxidoreductase [Paraburkholderia hospita]SKC90319.1 2,4-dienoyl-CoA reductase [Burkholderia sp. CF099]AUT71433.1 NADH:flavin oxidoreductase [Paraburkholderia hospita]OUL68477.1 NADH:flavin oxidoreductase [Paraburkholderia hospita]OUL74310.1 NADH:flavin oxidoreductase [Paraburkholderia hospita]SEI03021.1 2,4-dienoyl-CoA reductase [Paraburkholderia hospita]